jgi:hypothetical protein
VHEMATTLQPGDRVPMSWEEYEALAPDVRGEYVDGAFVVSPGAGGRHQDISLDGAPCVTPLRQRSDRPSRPSASAPDQVACPTRSTTTW